MVTVADVSDNSSSCSGKCHCHNKHSLSLLDSLKDWHSWNLDNRFFCFHLKNGNCIEIKKNYIAEIQKNDDSLLIQTTDNTPYLIRLSEVVYINFIVKYFCDSSQPDLSEQASSRVRPNIKIPIKDISEF